MALPTIFDDGYRLPFMKPYSSSRPAPKPSRFKKILRALGWLLLGLGVAAVLAVLGLSVVFLKPSQSAEQLAAEAVVQWPLAPSQFVEVDGVSVHVRDLGPRDDHQPIVMIPGTDSGMTAWYRWAEVLHQRRRLILLDLPGLGLSGALPDVREGSTAYARFMLHLLDRLGVQQCSLVGHALGGEVAWQTAYLAPERIARLTLIAPQGYPTEPWAVPLDEQLASTPALRWLTLWSRSRWVVERGMRVRIADQNKISPELIDRYYVLPLHEGNRRAQIKRLEQRLFASPTARLKTLHLPALILWGELDRQAPSEQAHWFARDIPGAKMLVLDNVGHVPHEEDPDRLLNDQVYGFIIK